MSYKEKQKDKKQFSKNLEGGDKQFDNIIPVQAKPLEIKVYSNFERALKIFRSMVQKERILSTYKEKQRYEKKSDKKRRKRNERKRKLMGLEEKDEK